MADRVLVLCGHRRKFQDMMNARGGDMRRLLIADRRQLLPPASSKLAGVLILDGVADDLRAEVAARFPGLASVAASAVIPEETADD